MNDHKKAKAMIIIMAKEDPNAFLQLAYTVGMDDEEREGLQYLIKIARRAVGYSADQDPFLKNGTR